MLTINSTIKKFIAIMISTMLLLAVYFSRDTEAIENQIEFKEVVINGDIGHEEQQFREVNLIIRIFNPGFRRLVLQ